MKYDFTTMPDRGGKDALAVDAIGANVSWGTAPTAPKAGFSKIPMWVADMNFATVPTIPQRIIQRAEHPLYGYYIPTDEYYDSIIRWHEQRNGVKGLCKAHIGYE
ncbi:MAG: aspartate aminotransferase, partial [Ruminococcus sp.]|nr:aspartate aminotransferase [Ruminococcus sp.]